MATLLKVRDALQHAGTVSLQELSAQMQASPTLIEAMLDRLIAMGRAERISVDRSCCAGCKGCSQNDACGDSALFRWLS